MNANHGKIAAAGRGDELLPIRPSALVRTVMRPMTRLLNPVLVRLAGKRHFPVAAQLHHVGRRSGRHYVTPVGARLSGDVIVIPLTFGNQSDWSKNVRAAGECTIRLNGASYHAVGPQFVGRDPGNPDALRAVKSAYNPMLRASFRMLGIRQFMVLRVVDPQ